MGFRYGKPSFFSLIVVRMDDEIYETYYNAYIQYGSRNGKEGFFVDDEFFSHSCFNYEAA